MILRQEFVLILCLLSNEILFVNAIQSCHTIDFQKQKFIVEFVILWVLDKQFFICSLKIIVFILVFNRKATPFTQIKFH